MTKETRVVLEKQLLRELLVFLDDEMKSSYDMVNTGFKRVYEKLKSIIKETKEIEPVSCLLELFEGRFYHFTNNVPCIAMEQIKQEEILILKLKGRCLPIKLRQWLWSYTLHNPQKLKENEWRLKANQTLLGVVEPWKSPIYAMVFRLVRDALKEDYAVFNEANNPEFADRIDSLVNQYFVLTKSHSAYFVPLAIPIVLIFFSKSAKELELLNIFAILIESYVHNPLRGDAIAGSQRVWRRLALELPQLFRHIENIFSKIPLVKKRLAILESPSEIFLSWLQVSFVGYLRVEALFYAWDQVFYFIITSI
ncbi:hypothetical protein THRCLA_01438 [Thraustotheca clavata]|uniref:Rab-GAP TBC domain-containing protein n=1 Tax=Thraustotheca clavata TaxID=74557 RepID=A0A1W0A882_9STRA|nr:hypothetical protein THRCLA_01438 [Thraustotheca clavata]